MVFHKPVLSCRTPVAFVLHSCRKTTPYRSPVALLSLSWRSPVAFSCRFPVACLSLLAISPSCCLPFAFMSLILSLCLVSCCFPVISLTQLCRRLSLPRCPPVAAPLLPSCVLPVASSRFPAAGLPLFCCFPVATLSSSCHHLVAFLSLPAAFRRRLPHAARI